MKSQSLVPISQSQAPYFLGVDIGGTNIKIGLVDDDGQALAFQRIETNPSAGPESACHRVAETCRRMACEAGLALEQVTGCGLGAPGPMSLKRRILLTPTNLPGWHFFPAPAELEKLLKIPVSFINDANAAAFGEFWKGVGAENESLALLTLGTGVGGGLISEGHLINGVNSFGSEAGHFIVDSRPDARLCNWGGGQGHLEAYASASAVALRAVEVLETGVTSALRERLDATEDVTAYDVYKAAKLGDEVALKIVDETAFYLGIGVTGVVHAVDPGLVVLGGAMNFGGPHCPVGQRFVHGIREEFRRRTFPNVFDGTKIDFATLGGNAGYIGAAGIARQQAQMQTN